MRCSVLLGAFTVLLRVGDDLPTFRRSHLKTVCVRQSANANIIAVYSTKTVIDEKRLVYAKCAFVLQYLTLSLLTFLLVF